VHQLVNKRPWYRNQKIIFITLFEVTLNSLTKTTVKSSKCLSPIQWLSGVHIQWLERPCLKTDQLTLPSGYIKKESRPSLTAPICLPCDKEKILAFRILRWLLNFQKILAVLPLTVMFSDLLLIFRHNISIPIDIVLILKNISVVSKMLKANVYQILNALHRNEFHVMHIKYVN